jgi:hypothetical protein
MPGSPANDRLARRSAALNGVFEVTSDCVENAESPALPGHGFFDLAVRALYETAEGKG